MNKTVGQMMDQVGVPSLGWLFDYMEIAEREIVEGEKKWPDKRKQIHNSFTLLCPPVSFRSKSHKLYESYCAELVERVAMGASLTTGTDAECLIALLSAATQAPLKSEYFAATKYLFKKVWGNQPWMGTDTPRESYAGALDEVISEIRLRVGKVAGR